MWLFLTLSLESSLHSENPKIWSSVTLLGSGKIEPSPAARPRIRASAVQLSAHGQGAQAQPEKKSSPGQNNTEYFERFYYYYNNYYYL